MHLWDNNRERHQRKYLEKQSHLVIILYQIPGAVVQVPLNTEGLENNKSHFKRRHLAEFLLLSRKEPGTWPG